MILCWRKRRLLRLKNILSYCSFSPLARTGRQTPWNRLKRVATTLGLSKRGQGGVGEGELAPLQTRSCNGQPKWLCPAVYFVLVQMAMGNPVPAQENFVQLGGVMHLHSQFSSGGETMEEIAQRATDRGLDVVILSDADALKVEYGLPFLRDLISFEREENALLTQGTLKNYLEEFKRVGRKYPDLILIEGVESTPYHYWDVDILQGRWSLKRWSTHLMAIDLGPLPAYEALPVMGGEQGKIWHWSSILMLWPLLGFVYIAVYGRYRSLRLSIAVGFVSLLCLLNNIPFKIAIMDAYQGDLGWAPYQNYIEYVNKSGGLVFWAHPQAGGGVHSDTFLGGLLEVERLDNAHENALLHTDGYTGFSALYGNDMSAAEPREQWDQVLRQYLSGERSHAVWGTGAYKRESGNIDDVQTVFLVEKKTREAVLEALAWGRMYVTQGGDDRLILYAFDVESGGYLGLAGEEVRGAGECIVHVQIGKADKTRERVKVTLIRSGKIVSEEVGLTPVNFDYTATIGESNEYFRVIAKTRTAKLVSNPIFVTGESR